mgnify:CR=1 FL=1
MTDIETTGDAGNHYCYGYDTNDIAKPATGYSLGFAGCCWVPFTNDANAQVQGGNFIVRAQINDINNNTPDVKLPPLWKIMAGCSGQMIDLNPQDADGDVVKCRWASTAEAEGAVHDPANFGSLTLDGDNCIVHYDGSMDATAVGVKPIAVMVEDFDAQGNVKSSIPVQFLGTVWTPSMGRSFTGWPNFFGHEDDHDDDHKEHFKRARGKKRGRREAPSYCTEVPTFPTGEKDKNGNPVNPDPNTLIVWPKGSVYEVTFKATSNLGTIDRYQFNKPIGMTCTSVNAQGETTCTWTATNPQENVDNNLCYIAVDSNGLNSERVCYTIRFQDPAPTTTTTTTITTTTITTTSTTTTTGTTTTRSALVCQSELDDVATHFCNLVDAYTAKSPKETRLCDRFTRFLCRFTKQRHQKCVRDGSGNDLIPQMLIDDAVGTTQVAQMEASIISMIDRKMPNCHWAVNPKRNLGRMMYRANRVQNSKP